VPLPHDPGPHWGEVGIHGLHRQREWDVLTTVEAPEVAGDDLWLVALADGRILVEEGEGDAARLAEALDLERPFRARAVRRDGAGWVVAGRRLETVELVDDPGGDTVEVAWTGRERTVRIDGSPTLAGVPELEVLGSRRHGAFVVLAARLDGTTWEVAVTPL
jgi:hypothetical protein